MFYASVVVQQYMCAYASVFPISMGPCMRLPMHAPLTLFYNMLLGYILKCYAHA